MNVIVITNNIPITDNLPETNIIKVNRLSILDYVIVRMYAIRNQPY
jgi:hypothetical protein